jgi:hemerythrin
MIIKKGTLMALVYIEQVEYMSIDEMQQTHENEIKILNEIDKLATLCDQGKATQEELENKLNEYIEHVHAHFANEEHLMQEYDFPSYEMHKMAHDMFLADLAYATKNWKEYGNINKIINFVRKTPEWIVMHVNSVDAPTADYLARKMDSV